MKIGIFDRVRSLPELAADLESAVEHGLDSYWITQAFGTDTLTVIGALGRSVDLAIGTAVVPTYPRHPMVLAQQALTVNLLLGGRLRLGIGSSHRPVVEGSWGLSHAQPLRHTEEYLSALTQALCQRARFRGELITANGDLDVPGATAPPVFVSALGPRMLQLAGRLAAGTITWMVGPRTLADLTVPTIRAAAVAAGRPAPEVVVCVPMCLTSDVDAAWQVAQSEFGWYGDLSSYRAMLDREGLRSSAQVAVVGDEDVLRAAVGDYRQAGATTLAVRPFGSAAERRDTSRLLGQLAGGPG
jgi:5,10-methylenetetrahydromethanopterin reductase